MKRKDRYRKHRRIKKRDPLKWAEYWLLNRGKHQDLLLQMHFSLTAGR
jgi:hypothetical protein